MYGYGKATGVAVVAGLLWAGSTLAATDADIVDDRLDRRGDRIETHLDNKGDRIDQRLDAKGDRIDQHLDVRGDRIDAKLDRRSDAAAAQGNDGLAAKLDRKGDRIDAHLDQKELLSNVVYSKLALGGFPAVDCAFINTVDELHAGNHISELPEST